MATPNDKQMVDTICEMLNDVDDDEWNDAYEVLWEMLRLVRPLSTDPTRCSKFEIEKEKAEN
tara:strand:- start:12422 stop:12607 length:186 start_codon:yes stop_codon:yes gene_type:complete